MELKQQHGEWVVIERELADGTKDYLVKFKESRKFPRYVQFPTAELVGTKTKAIELRDKLNGRLIVDERKLP